MLISVSMNKPKKVDLNVLKSIFGSTLYRSQDAHIMSKYPVIPRGRQFRDLKGNTEEVAIRVDAERKDAVYIGFRLDLDKTNVWTYTPVLFNVYNGKVNDYSVMSKPWVGFKDVKYLGIKLPDNFKSNRDYRNLWFSKKFIASNSPLALIEVIPPKEIKP